MIIKILLCLAGAGLIILIAGVLASQKLTVTHYREHIDTAGNGVRIVFISDVHCRKFGADNSKLIALVAEQEPDIIAVVGDLVSRGSTDEQIGDMCALISELSHIAPTYYTVGNHESDYIAENGTQLLDRITAAGAKVLDGEYNDLDIGGTCFRLGGMSRLAYKDGSGRYDPQAQTFLTDYCDTKLPTVMLSHRPEAFFFNRGCADWDIDLILSGHTHGGLVRLPLIGGLAAPIQGLFPKVYYGEYEFYGTRMIVTSGLAGYGLMPRVFNPPEICVLTLTAD